MLRSDIYRSILSGRSWAVSMVATLCKATPKDINARAASAAGDAKLQQLDGSPFPDRRTTTTTTTPMSNAAGRRLASEGQSERRRPNGTSTDDGDGTAVSVPSYDARLRRMETTRARARTDGVQNVQRCSANPKLDVGLGDWQSDFALRRSCFKPS
jgi:hypothetical protein